MSGLMRAKMQVTKVEKFDSSERISFTAVAAKAYPADGSDEDNTYAKFSPAGQLSLTIANPALLGKIEHGQKFYLDFTLAAAAVAKEAPVNDDPNSELAATGLAKPG